MEPGEHLSNAGRERRCQVIEEYSNSSSELSCFAEADELAA
jgi:hypothetical protein